MVNEQATAKCSVLVGNASN